MNAALSLQLGGTLLIALGVGLIFVPAGVITLGVAALAFGLAAERTQ